jgi:hypothetical protein
MRVLIDGVLHDALSPAHEHDVRQFGARETVQGVVLSADEATKAHVSQIALSLVILWAVIALAAAGIVLLAEPADQAVILTWAVFVVGALGVFFAFQVWRRTRTWRRDLPRRLAGLAPAGSAIGVDASGIAVAGRIFLWPTLAIEQVELAKFGARRRVMFTLERLTLAGPRGTIVLDPTMMRNGQLIIGNAWRCMRLAAGS